MKGQTSIAHGVFISYSSKDNTKGTAVCSTLEDHKIRCWIAPRDVPPGMHYGAALDHAIANSKVFVLVLSRGPNTSDQVIRELEIAADNGIPIMPVRIEDFEPTEAVRYYTKSVNWLDAMTPPIERHLEKLAARVQVMLNLDIPRELQSAPIPKEELRPPVHRNRMPRWATIAVGILAVLLLGLLGVWFSGGMGCLILYLGTLRRIGMPKAGASGERFHSSRQFLQIRSYLKRASATPKG